MSIKLTQEEVINNADNVHGDWYKYGEYKNTKELWDIWCPIHGWFEQRYDAHIQQKQGCPFCGRESQKNKITYDADYFIKQASQKVNSHILVKKEDYKGWRISMKAICNHPVHPHGEITIRPDIYIRLNSRCKTCKSEERGKLFRDKAEKEFIAYIKKHHPEGKTLNFSRWEYGKDCFDKGWMGCNICNEWWEVTATSLKQGSGCPYHRKSRGEQEAKRILKKLKREYESQKWFEDCRNPLNNRRLYFDVCDVKSGGLMEYDGEGHFKPVRWNGISMVRAIEIFKKAKKRDREKTKYCKKHHIPLLHIPYWKYKDMEGIIKKFLKLK